MKIEKICSNSKCGVKFDAFSKWGYEKKFCSRSCANSREQTEDIRKRKSRKLLKEHKCKYCEFTTLGKGPLVLHQKSCKNNPNRIEGTFFGLKHSTLTKSKIGKGNKEGLKTPESVLDMSKRTVAKLMKRMNIGCSRCGWKEAACDIHHIIPKSKGGTDDNDNLTILCPNCHRLAHSNKLTEFISVKEQVGETWREHYYAHE